MLWTVVILLAVAALALWGLLSFQSAPYPHRLWDWDAPYWDRRRR